MTVTDRMEQVPALDPGWDILLGLLPHWMAEQMSRSLQEVGYTTEIVPAGKRWRVRFRRVASHSSGAAHQTTKAALRCQTR